MSDRTCSVCCTREGPVCPSCASALSAAREAAFREGAEAMKAVAVRECEAIAMRHYTRADALEDQKREPAHQQLRRHLGQGATECEMRIRALPLPEVPQ